MTLSKTLVGNIHESASTKLRETIFPVLRVDDIVRGIEYDWLVIAYCNKMCVKYTLPHQYDMIRARIRLVGRLLFAVKNINAGVTNFAEIFDAKYYEDCINGVRKVAGYNEQLGTFRTPVVAMALETLIKCIGLILRSHWIKAHEPAKQKDTEDFLKILEEDFGFSISKPALETQQRAQRKKKFHYLL